MQAAIAAGAALGDPRSPVVDEKAGVFAVVPKEYKVESLEKFLPRPLADRAERSSCTTPTRSSRT